MINSGWVDYSGRVTWERLGRSLRARADSYPAITLRYTRKKLFVSGC
jgi:hypothetical protein